MKIVFKLLKRVMLILSLLLYISCVQNDTSIYYVENVSAPVINLNGTWKINENPSNFFWEGEGIDNEWKNIEVPGECMMQGILIKHDKPFVYKKRIKIPEDYSGKRIILRFEGVYSYARVWINGEYIRDHSGGFTQWECDITPFVKPNEVVLLFLEVTDKANEISYGSGYAEHMVGGILRDVSLLALPMNFPKDVCTTTNFDENYENVELSVTGKLNDKVENAQIEIQLKDKNGNIIQLDNSKLTLNSKNTFQINNLVLSPHKWDAEHPNLYELRLSYLENNNLLYQKTFQIGFREIEVTANKLLVNGKPVKLRGACRHDIHPLLGRVSTPDYELKDVLLAKEANINFIRTSHYPPTENFLRLCDKYGIYVEDETAICFVDTWRREDYAPGATENDKSYAKKYLSQLEEMILSHKNHPSVIIWSIGNENKFGDNFKKSYDLVKEFDKTRPVIFSYPGHVPDSIKAYDILSFHYPYLNGSKDEFGKIIKNFGNNVKDIPVVFDEWAHVACYNYSTIKEDPNVRNFWGQSIDSMWTKVFDAEGGLGGAIWGMIDETFMMPESLSGFNKWWGMIGKNKALQPYKGTTIGYGEWGIIDVWRRKKPEFWNTKKAYSPVKLLQTTFDSYKQGESLNIPVFNRYNHTNLNELEIKYLYKGITNTLNPVDIEPNSKGTLNLPVKNWGSEEIILLEIFDLKGRLVDKYALRQRNNSNVEKPAELTEKISILDEKDRLTVICANHSRIIFDKKNGLIKEIQNSSKIIPFSGPYINLLIQGNTPPQTLSKKYRISWKLKEFSYKKQENTVIFEIKGKNSKLKSIDFEIYISSDGIIKTKYHIEKVPKKYIREMGIAYDLNYELDSVSWKRDAYWSYYPFNHLGAPEGKVSLYSNIGNIYRKPPKKDWVFDTKSFYYDGTKNEEAGKQLTFIAKSTKENIIMYNLHQRNQEILSVLGKGRTHCRITKSNNTIRLIMNNVEDYLDLSWGNYQRNIILDNNYEDEVTVKINAK